MFPHGLLLLKELLRISIAERVRRRKQRDLSMSVVLRKQDASSYVFMIVFSLSGVTAVVGSSADDTTAVI